MAYVRSAAKRHGKQNRIEGRVNEGALAVVVEDLVSTGGSSLEAVRCLRESGVTIAAVLAIFSYELPVAATAFAAAEVPLETLTSFSTLVKVAEKDGQLDAPSVERLRIWHRGLSRMPSP
jgi:orotate phosphoribosyltransferase